MVMWFAFTGMLVWIEIISDVKLKRLILKVKPINVTIDLTFPYNLYNL